MGLFDTINVLDEDKRITCAHGHVLVENNFQTKNLGEGMSSYYIVSGYFCSPGPTRRHVFQDPAPGSMPIFVRREDHQLVPLLDAKLFEMYTSCRQCAPIYTRSHMENYVTRSNFHPHHPWVELDIETERGTGKVITVTPSRRQQTRDQLRKQLADGGSAVVADDDPMLLHYLEKRKP